MREKPPEQVTRIPEQVFRINEAAEQSRKDWEKVELKPRRNRLQTVLLIIGTVAGVVSTVLALMD